MGFLGNLFGSKDPDAVSRCMECGMADGRHTDWCPAVAEEGAEERETEEEAGASSSPGESAGEGRAEGRAGSRPSG